jgi:hypothetical protein
MTLPKASFIPPAFASFCHGASRSDLDRQRQREKAELHDRIEAMKHLSALVEFLEGGPGDRRERERVFVEQFGPALADVRRASCRGTGMQQVTTGYYSTRLRDGTLGYLQRRGDDCLQAAIASLLQVPMPRVPDLRIAHLRIAGHDEDELARAVNRQLGRWIEENGLNVYLHTSPAVSERRWIGVIPGDVPGADHCLLMAGRDCLFDPDVFWPPGSDEPATKLDVGDIEYAITIE